MSSHFSEHDHAMSLHALQGYLAGGSNTEDLEKTIQLLSHAIEHELTDTQHLYITDYYYNGKTMHEIATLHGVHKSTVSRTLARARKRIYDSLKYVVLRKELE